MQRAMLQRIRQNMVRRCASYNEVGGSSSQTFTLISTAACPFYQSTFQKYSLVFHLPYQMYTKFTVLQKLYFALATIGSLLKNARNLIRYNSPNQKESNLGTPCILGHTLYTSDILHFHQNGTD